MPSLSSATGLAAIPGPTSSLMLGRSTGGLV